MVDTEIKGGQTCRRRAIYDSACLNLTLVAWIDVHDRLRLIWVIYEAVPWIIVRGVQVISCC